MGLSLNSDTVNNRLPPRDIPPLHCLPLILEIQSFPVHVQSVWGIWMDYVTQTLDRYCSSYNSIQGAQMKNPCA